jgi:2-hydroxy-6-oxonona-2,4-dienedioate hydrolase
MRLSRSSIVLTLVLSLFAGRMPAQQATTAAESASPFIDSKQQTIPTVGKFVTVFGAKIHYVDVGSGPSVILLHGLADDIGVWASVIRALAAKLRVIALDQLGFGDSDKPLLNYRVSTFVDFLHGFLNELKLERASLVGNSLGGWVAADFALKYPDRVERLVLSDAAGYAALPKSMNPRALSALRLASREDIRYLGPLTFHDERFYEDVDLAFKQRVAAGDSYTVGQVVDSMIRGEDVLDGRLGAIKQPTLIVWGREDKPIPLSFGERFHQEINASRLHVIDNCGHMPHVECPEKLNAVLLQFLGDTK